MKNSNNTNSFLVKDIYLLESKINCLISHFEIFLCKDINIKEFIYYLKSNVSNVSNGSNFNKYPLHLIFEDNENNLIKVETKQNILSPILFINEIADNKDILSITPIIK
jgi:hypothetical protein